MNRAAILTLLIAAPAHAMLQPIQLSAWSRPGADPYTGTPAAAMEAAHIPADARARLLDRIERGDRTGHVLIREDGITDAATGEPFSDRFDMGSGHGWATGVRAAFGPNRTERAEYYRDGEYVLMRPDICGNWSRLYSPGYPHHVAPPPVALPYLDLPGGHYPGRPPVGIVPGWPIAGSVPPGYLPPGFAPPIAYAPPGIGPGSVPGVPLIPGPATTLPPGLPVPAPATAACVALGLALIAAARRTHPAGARA